ncbi:MULTISPECIES: YrrS family protein [unclassified Jeotgalibaca]|uniref:YrrS family protein n=1 Tax=unclassified Jeotgalibaca TaxID=2621505 RepID=UPI003FD2EEFE
MSDKIQSRAQRNKHNKKNNGRSDLVLKLSIGLLVLAIFILLLELIYPGSNGANENDLALDSKQSESSMIIQETESEVDSESSEESVESTESKESESKESEESEVREVASNDPNVIKAYVGDWAPIGTTQTGTHVTNYNDGSADRIEIKQATAQATGIPEGDMVEYWIGNDGDQRVTATIMQTSTGRFYKAYLTWVDGKGWQVTRYDEIKEVVQ